MVVQLVITAVLGLLSTLFSALPTFTLPYALQYSDCQSQPAGDPWNIVCRAAGYGTDAAPFRDWVPLDAAVTAAELIITAYGIVVTVRLIRIALSLFTGGGGGS